MLLLLPSRFSRVQLCDPIDGSPPGSPVPGILQARTGVGCHFLLQCMKVKSESEVAQSCLTLSDPMDYSPPASSIRGIFQARVLEWGAIAFSEEQMGQIENNRKMVIVLSVNCLRTSLMIQWVGISLPMREHRFSA